jgi:hypothetical protein
MENKSLLTTHQLDSKLLIRKLQLSKPTNEYENLVSIFLNLWNLELEDNEGAFKKVNYSK